MNYFRKKSVPLILQELESKKKSKESLGKYLTQKDLVFFGIAAIVGAGVFSTIGKASFDGGPAVIFLFLFTALACSFAAMAYAEFASMVPVSGSAYTYSYVAFGEIIAWIIGWSLIMECAIGNITLAISWSDYFTGLLSTMGIDVPLWMQIDYLSARNGFNEANALVEAGKTFANLPLYTQQAHDAWVSAPQIFGFHFVADLPALLIIFLITWLVYRGIQESRNASNIMVWIKLLVIVLVLVVGIFYVDTSNWSPFAPNGVNGVLKGVSAVFFAYIGFDAISTTAEECKDPQRDLPRGMIWAIVICTVLYVAIALILTGMVNYKNLNIMGKSNEKKKINRTSIKDSKKETKKEKRNKNKKEKKKTKKNEDNSQVDDNEENEEENFEELILPGQKFATPPAGDATRAFYESLLEQRPDSLMAKKYCVEYGCVDADKAKEFIEILEKNKKKKK